MIGLTGKSHATMSPRHCTTVPPLHRITVSVICLAPCHQTSQSFALPPATKPVSHLTCPLLPHHHTTVSPCQSVICLAPCHQTSQSFALPLPPNQSIICLAPCHQTSQSFDLPSTTTLPHHCITMLVSHLPCPLPPNQSVICLTPCHQTSQSFDLPSTTTSLHHRVTASQHHHITMSPC